MDWTPEAAEKRRQDRLRRGQQRDYRPLETEWTPEAAQVRLLDKYSKMNSNEIYGWYVRQNPDDTDDTGYTNFYNSLQKKLNIYSGTTQEDKDLQIWATSTEDFIKQMGTDYTQRKGKYQDATQFGQYVTGKNAEIDTLIKSAEDAMIYYKQYGDTYDSVYGKGSAEAMLSSLQKGLDYLNGAKADLSAELEGWKQFTNEDDYNQKIEAYDNAYGKGNIDLTQSGIYQNQDGSYTYSPEPIIIYDNYSPVVIPTVVNDNGVMKKLTAVEAQKRYQSTGEYLGKFNTAFEAADYMTNILPAMLPRTAAQLGEELTREQTKLGDLNKQLSDEKLLSVALNPTEPNPSESAGDLQQQITDQEDKIASINSEKNIAEKAEEIAGIEQQALNDPEFEKYYEIAKNSPDNRLENFLKSLKDPSIWNILGNAVKFMGKVF